MTSSPAPPSLPLRCITRGVPNIRRVHRFAERSWDSFNTVQGRRFKSWFHDSSGNTDNASETANFAHVPVSCRRVLLLLVPVVGVAAEVPFWRMIPSWQRCEDTRWRKNYQELRRKRSHFKWGVGGRMKKQHAVLHRNLRCAVLVLARLLNFPSPCRPRPWSRVLLNRDPTGCFDSVLDVLPSGSGQVHRFPWKLGKFRPWREVSHFYWNPPEGHAI